MTKRHHFTILTLVAGLAISAAGAADPPATINYQGVLRDAADKPRNGSFDMVFRFFDAASGGNEILVDAHTGGAAVVVSNGLFNVPLGGGAVSDGSGAGTYATLTQVFGDFGAVWLEIAIGPETLSPRVQVRSSAYALNTGSLEGRPASSFLDTSATPQVKTGQLQVNASGSIAILGGTYPIVADSPDHGGAFVNEIGSSALLAEDTEGIHAEGVATGGTFTSLSGQATAALATADYGVSAFGASPGAAGHFKELFGTGEAFLGQGDTGLVATGNQIAGQFDSPLGRHAFLASDGYQSSGLFQAPNSQVSLASGNIGLEATGVSVGGRFTSGGKSAELATNLIGTAGYFYDQPTGIFAALVTGTNSLAANGVKAFVQNHPTDMQRVIVYAALEGSEAGTYTRGTGRLRGGEVRIALEPTFALTTDPDIGLTAVVTPRGPHSDLYVASVSTKEIVVRSGAPLQDEVAFDYLVNGLRLGFENRPAIVPSDLFPSATVPTLESGDAKLDGQPDDARASTPFARFAAAESVADGGAAAGSAAAGSTAGAGRMPAPDPRAADLLSGARALIAGINAPEHALHALSPSTDPRDPAAPGGPAGGAATSHGPSAASSGTTPGHDAGTGAMAGGATNVPSAPKPAAAPGDTGTDVRSVGAGETVPAITLSVRGTVEAGDVVANDAATPGTLRRADLDGDPAVVGVVAGPPGSSFLSRAPIALAGTVVLCKGDATERPIEANDLLVASSLPGFARSGGAEARPGTIVGKALEPLAAGTGTIRILVMSR